MPARTTTAKAPSVKQKRQEQEQHTKNRLQTWLKKNATDAKEVRVRLTAEDAKIILGWTVTDKDDHHFVDENGDKIVCLNNEGNRDVPGSALKAQALDILNGGWAFNGETMTVGVSGNILSAQRRLIGLVFAEQMRLKYPARWQAYWEEPCYIDTVVLYNIDDSQKTAQTVDNTRPRTTFDVFYTDPALAKYKPKERKTLARYLDVAVRVLWQRTGMEDDMFHTRRCNSEVMAFYRRHPKILAAVQHIYEEDTNERYITSPGGFVGAGTAAALLYLMGTSASDRDAYQSPKANKDGIKERNEKSLDFSRWDKAQEFWLMLAQAKAGNMNDLAKALAKVRRPVDDPNDKSSGLIFGDGSTRERAAVLCKAWELYLSGEEPTVKSLKLRYKPDPNPQTMVFDQTCLLEDPTVGGIDMGWGFLRSKERVPEEAANGSNGVAGRDVPAGEPTPEEIQAQAAGIKAENAAAAGLTDTGNLD